MCVGEHQNKVLAVYYTNVT